MASHFARLVCTIGSLNHYILAEVYPYNTCMSFLFLRCYLSFCCTTSEHSPDPRAVKQVALTLNPCQASPACHIRWCRPTPLS